MALLLPAVLSWLWWLHPPGTVSCRAPVQRPLTGSAPAISLHGWTLKPLARFTVEARVLGLKHYRDGLTAAISPYDIALGWGPMSDATVLDRLEISQGDRFYHWRYWGSSPIPEEEITRNSANMHLMPADSTVLDRIAAFQKGGVVRLSGCLVDATHPHGERPWRSSLTRDDTGNGACEIIYVTSAEEVRRP